ncbi:MAG: UDP-N-acetylmuramoyl-L-alanine--D-glutamate ligase [Alphaproteobacteria bacterium]|nr:UDP-N-acetylmuramoyl-L-alanine--D-glutamate ligase [Alphaproteobacteria bacterium]
MGLIDVFAFNGLPVAVLGLGKSGRVAAEALVAAGAEVRAWDDSEAARQAAAARGIPIVDLLKTDWREITTLVISPGIPHTHPAPHPVAALARQHNAELIGDIELLARSIREPSWIGITGTNGKSTTTALVGHILQTAGRAVQVGGNIGTPALSLEPLGPEGIYVLEMSSYQLEITSSITFDVAVLLNVTPDHLDRHGGMDGYVAAKRRIFNRQTSPRVAVVGVDDAITAGICSALQQAGDQVVVPISAEKRLTRGVFVLDGHLVDATGAAAREIADLRPIATLPGRHNWQNAAAAYAVCRAVGVPENAIVAGLSSYPGLAHRQERVATLRGVAYVNDSKATNADAASKALGCYDSIWWIAGGLAKEGGIDSLGPFFPRIRKAYLIGKAAGDFAVTLAAAGVPYEPCGTLDDAVAAAARDADAAGTSARERIVLLSPACASFDQFANFEARGNRFRELVHALEQEGQAA